MERKFRIFISSPSDVKPERRRAAEVIKRLAQEYAGTLLIEPYLWDDEPMIASGTFQDVIESPSDAAIVVLIVWKRLGVPLPAATKKRTYCGMDGRVPVTGTEWEYETALQASMSSGTPLILAYRKSEPVLAPLDNPAEKQAIEDQYRALQGFWSRHFATDGTTQTAHCTFPTLDEFGTKLESDLKKLIERSVESSGAASGAAPRAARRLSGNPYRGLLAYQFEHANLYFGRTSSVRLGVERLVLGERAKRAFLLVIGGSGTGKSSLVQAGILPMLMTPGVVSGGGAWRRAILRPGIAPFAALAEALTAPAAVPEIIAPEQSLPGFAQHVADAPTNAAYAVSTTLATLRRQSLQAGQPGRGIQLVLVVDQLEELFSNPRITPPMMSRFVECIDRLACTEGVYVVATMRSDYWHRVVEVPLLKEMQQPEHGRLELSPMTVAEIREVLRGPAAAAGLTFEEDPRSGIGLDAMLAEEAASEPGALPLLSFLLDAIYRKDIESAPDAVMLTVATAQDQGGLRGAIATRAEQVLEQQPKEVQSALPEMLRRLVQTRYGAEAVARVARLDDIGQGTALRALVDEFLSSEARLLTADSDGVSALVRLAHEALLTRWTRAAEWVKQNRRDLETRDRLEHDLALWEAVPAGPEKKQRLLRGLALAEGRDLAKRWPDIATSRLGPFIRLSYDAARRTARRWFAFAGVIVVLMSLLAGVAIFNAIRASQDADSVQNAADNMITKVVHDTRFTAGITQQSRLVILPGIQQGMETLFPDSNQSPRVRLSRLRIYEEFANAYWYSGDVVNGFRFLSKALTLDRDLLKSDLPAADRLRTMDQETEALVTLANFLNLEGSPKTIPTLEQAKEVATAMSQTLKSSRDKKPVDVRDPDLIYSAVEGRIGDIERTAGNFSAAQRDYEQSATLQDNGMRSAPDDPAWMRERSQTYNRLGDNRLRIVAHEIVMTVADDGTAAFARNPEFSLAQSDYKEGLALRQKLVDLDVKEKEQDKDKDKDKKAKQDKTNDHLSDLVWSFAVYGMSLTATDPQAALVSLNEGAKYIKTLVESDPQNTEWRRYHALIQTFSGDAYLLSRRVDLAIPAYESALKDRETLRDTDVKNLRWQRDLFYTRDRTAHVYAILHKRQEQQELLAKAIELADQIESQLPRDQQLQDEIRRVKQLPLDERGK